MRAILLERGEKENANTMYRRTSKVPFFACFPCAVQHLKKHTRASKKVDSGRLAGPTSEAEMGIFLFLFLVCFVLAMLRGDAKETIR